MVDLLFSYCTPASYSNHSFSCSYPDACEAAQWTYQYPYDKIEISAWTNLKVRTDEVEELSAGHGLKNLECQRAKIMFLNTCVLQTEIWAIGQTAFLSAIPHRKAKGNKKCMREFSQQTVQKWRWQSCAFSRDDMWQCKTQHREMQAQNCPCIKNYFDCWSVTSDVLLMYFPINWGQSTDRFSLLVQSLFY